MIRTPDEAFAAGFRAAHPPCPKCAGLGGVHYLTCPALRLPPRRMIGTRELLAMDRYADGGDGS